jgi:hypothetical protein
MLALSIVALNASVLVYEPLRELLIEGLVRIAGWAGEKDTGKRELSSGNTL